MCIAKKERKNKMAVQSGKKKNRSKNSTQGLSLRLSVYRSRKHIYASVIDDTRQCVLVSASTVDASIRASIRSTSTVEAASHVGRLLSERALKSNVDRVVFDRGRFRYHGRVRALADAARESGLVF